MERINFAQRKSYILNQRQPIRIKKTSLLRRKNHAVIDKKMSLRTRLQRLMLKWKWMIMLTFYEMEINKNNADGIK
jgi:hypothetical protein